MTDLPRLFVLVDTNNLPLVPKGQRTHHFNNKMVAKTHKRKLEEMGHTVFLKPGPDHYKSNGGSRL